MATKHKLQQLTEKATAFVIEQNGVWDHQAWEALVEDLSSPGLQFTDECKRNLGNLLEAAKYFYQTMPAEPPKKAAAKAKAPAKTKAKSKKGE